MKTLYITKKNTDFISHCNNTLDLSSVTLPNTFYLLNQTINQYLDESNIDYVDLCILDETSYKSILLTSKVIDNYIWKLIPSMFQRIKRFIVVDTSTKKSEDYGIRYLELLKRAQQPVPDYKVVHITEWKKIIEDFRDSKEIGLDFEASSLYPQQLSFYIGGVGLYNGKSAYYIWDNELRTRLNDTIQTHRPEWVELGEFLKDKKIIIYNLGYENKVFATRMGGVIKNPHDVLADLRCLVKSGSLKVTAVQQMGVPDWADDVQHWVGYTNDLLSWLRNKLRGVYKWYKRFVNEKGEPSIDSLIHWYKSELVAYRQEEVQRQFDELKSYLNNLNGGKGRELTKEDILFEKGKIKVSVEDLYLEDDEEELIKSPLEGTNLAELQEKVNEYLYENTAVDLDFSDKLSGKDYNIFTTLVKMEDLLDEWKVTWKEYESLLLKLWNAEEECKYTDVPLECCAKYCIIDTVNTYNLYKIIRLEIESRGIEYASEIYQEQDILADRMERASIAWDDEVAQKHQDIYISTALDSLKKLFLSPRGLKVLKLNDSQILEIQTTQDLEVLKSYLNPSSYTEDTKKKFSYLMVDPAVKIGYMYHELNTAFLSHPDSTWFEDVYPTLSKYYFKMKDMYCFYENYGTKETDEKDENGNPVVVKCKFEDIPEDTIKEWLKDLRDELYRQANNFQEIGNACLETRSEQGFKFKGQPNEVKLEFELLDQVRNFSLPGTSAATIEWMYEVYTKAMGVNAEYQWTWTDCFWNLYYFRMYKKVMKSNNTYVEGSLGRELVVRVVTPHEAETFEFDKFYNEITDKTDCGTGWIVKTHFSPNTAETKRWQAGQQTVPWKSENMDRRVSRFRDHGIRIHYDYSQAEVRVMAKASNDKNLMDAFYRDADIHRFVASRVFAKPEVEITEAERRFSKMAVFSLLYGKTEVGMANDFMQGDVERARKLFNDFYTAFPTIKTFIRNKHKEALTTGKVTTIFGDILDVKMPEFALEFSDEVKEKLMDNAFDKSLKLDRDSAMAIATALRHAQNYPIQSASSSLAALGIKGISDYFLEIGSPAKIDCFTHDSADIDVPICDIYSVMKAIPEIAVTRPRTKYGIPMKVDIDWSVSSDHPIEVSKLEMDDEKKTIKCEFEGKKQAMDWLFDRLKRNGVKVSYEITKEDNKGVSMKELFITRRAFSLDIGKKLSFVEGIATFDFSEVIRAY